MNRVAIKEKKAIFLQLKQQANIYFAFNFLDVAQFKEV
jgi:hypothetical protein